MKKIEEGPLQDRRKSQARQKRRMDLLRRKQVQQRMATSRAAKEKEKTDIVARRGLRQSQSSKHAQKNWRQEGVEVDEDYAAMKAAQAHAKKKGHNYDGDVSVQHRYDAYHMKKRGYTHFKSGSYGSRSYTKGDTQPNNHKIGPEHHKGVSDEYEPQGTELDEKDLSYKERQDMSSSQFALPGKGEGPEGKQGGSYPIPDESHARNALARVSQHGSEAEKAKVRRAVSSKYPNIKIGESKETEAGERDFGSDAYTDYVKGLTPGQEADSAVTGKNAKKESSISKKNTDEKAKLAGLDDEYVPTLEEYAAHLDTLDEDALETELENLSQNELLEILGTGLVKKAAGAIKKRFSVAGRSAAAQKKGAKIAAKTSLATQKTSNIAAKAGLKKAKAGLKAAKGPGVVKKAASAVGGAAKKVIGAAPKKPVKVKSVPGKGIVAAEYNPESLIAQAMDELSKK